ncbi:glycoside hydrolase family 31 protein [Pontibacter qinzhouensis]|uniref:Glycoside hydrolase family 31 protein n=1 Tax=Pontibacter qinzhouensis TaxID=2603253 RepID=A0A5C8KB24_9BACT|nr:TIM-barrel domain-containing protein [Pontibacter qinzhouensis]TXK48893.1 glycoside hydrolase family 31 protein [Pontibacter qinzhouensis]
MFPKLHFKALFLLISLFTYQAVAQTGIGNYQSGFQKKGNEVFFTNSGGEVRLEFCTPDMFRVRASWNKQFLPNEPYMVIKYDWPAVQLQTSEQSDHFLLQTDKLHIKVIKNPFRIEVSTADGKLLSADALAGREGGLTKQGEAVAVSKQLLPDEHFFGFGERMDFLDQRNKKLKMDVGRGKGLPHHVGAYNVLEANYCPVPFFMSTRGYGIFFHTAYPTEWDMGNSNPSTYSFKAEGGELDYYFMSGPSFKDLLNQYTSLTGKSPMLSEFALGLHVGTYSGGTWGYEHLTSDTYVVELGRKFRTHGIPADLLHLDSTWRIFGKVGGKGATSFEWRETFKDPKGMFDSLYAMNYKMVGLHLRPRFDNGTKLNLLDQARTAGFVYPEKDNPGEFVNFFDQKAVDWWWQNGVKRIADQGAMFLKTDEGSAFGGLANESDKVGPTGDSIKWMHNVFPLVYTKASFEKFQEHNGMRGMAHTREGYAGIQRYPFIWAGDWPSEWQYFAPVIKAGLNVGMSGVSYWSHNMGGFEHVADPELYIRWVQFGMFSPIAHLLGMEHPNYKEPWNYGEDALRNFKKYDLLRYQLIPYIYSQAYVNHTTGTPLMRALVLEHQNDPNVYDITDQYLFGSNLLVNPVTTKGAKTRTIYLPEGTWFDYWTGKQHEGRQFVHVLTPLGTIPIFAKGGAILPMQPEMRYIGEKPVNTITLDIFPHGSSKFELYEDDGKSLNYQKGAFAITEITSEQTAAGLTLKVQKPKGNFQPLTHNYLAKIHWNGAKAPTAISENGKKTAALKTTAALEKGDGWFYDAQSKVLWVKTKRSNKEDITIVVK